MIRPAPGDSPEGAVGLVPGDRDLAASLLRDAEDHRRPIAPLTARFPSMTVRDAYLIQLLNIGARTGAGSSVVGHKVGLSSAAMQEMMGVDEPDYGHLLSGMLIEEGGTVGTGAMIQPRVEVEPAFVLGASLPAPGCTLEDVARCTAAVVPSLEIIDSRIADWTLSLRDTIADNASSGRVVLGASRVSLDEARLLDTDARLAVNGAVIDTGNTNAVLGNPLAAVAWLANKVYEFGVRLEAGHVVLPGSCMRAHAIGPGDDVEAELDGIGSVSVRVR